MDIRKILRRLREKHSDRRIAKDLNINRRTVQRYRAWAIAENLLRELELINYPEI